MQKKCEQIKNKLYYKRRTDKKRKEMNVVNGDY